MNEIQFLEKWQSERPIYEAWGSFVKQEIVSELGKRNVDPDNFIKVSSEPRLKADDSLIDKAFYRPGKNYSDPYEEIEDKVGLRFVVLLLEGIDLLVDIIKSNSFWSFDECKHFTQDRRNEPLLFTYQSVHFILRPIKEIRINELDVPINTPCEVQIRTLLQHAHAELTHDAIYKAKRTIQPEVHRTVAKSMALIETTDDFFKEVTSRLDGGPLQDHNVVDRLNGLYYSFIGFPPSNKKSSLVIWDEFEDVLDESLCDEVQEFINKNEHLSKFIVGKYRENGLYQQSIILFLYWMLKKRRRRLVRDWPLDMQLLEPIATDLGISLSRH